MSENTIKCPFNVTDATEEIIDFLVMVGILYHGEDGELHVIDTKKKSEVRK